MNTPSEANDIRSLTLERSGQYLNPARDALLKSMDIDFVASHSSGYKVLDQNGREFIDLDLRAGVYNLGHRNPAITKALTDALEYCDMGFALFSGKFEAELAEKLTTSTRMDYVTFTASGTEANDLAIRSARRETGKRRIVSCSQGYHGAVGLSSAAGNPSTSLSFNSGYPDEFSTIEVNNADQLEKELKMGDVAAVILEPVCNAAGYPTAPANYWSQVRSLCDYYESLLIMDEVVTGLGKSGRTWGFQKIGIRPDIVVTGKALSGGIYPIAAAIFSRGKASWFKDEFMAYAGTFAGGDLACAVGNAAFDISTSKETLDKVDTLSDFFREGLEAIQTKHSIIKQIRNFGLLFSLDMDLPGANLLMTQALFKHGVLTFPAINANTLVNLKPGILMDEKLCSEALNRIEDSVKSI